MSNQIKIVTIIGLGLIGGSLGMAIRKKKLAEKVVGVPRREESIKEAKDKGAIDEGALDLAEGVKEADLVFICTPIISIISSLRLMAPALKKGCIVTDVGSTKSEIVKEAEQIVPAGVSFIGGHPMAGKEKTGVLNAEATLLEEAPYILTPTQKTNRQALETLKSFLKNLNVKLMELTPQQHDGFVAGVSHLPLAISISLVNTIADLKEREEMLKLAAGGFRDSTRIAAGSPIMGRDMFLTNKEPILKMIRTFKTTLGKLEKLIEEGDAEGLLKELEKAKKLREGI